MKRELVIIEIHDDEIGITATPLMGDNGEIVARMPAEHLADLLREAIVAIENHDPNILTLPKGSSIGVFPRERLQ